jgi:hypothetical protein
MFSWQKKRAAYNIEASCLFKKFPAVIPKGRDFVPNNRDFVPLSRKVAVAELWGHDPE